MVRRLLKVCVFDVYIDVIYFYFVFLGIGQGRITQNLKDAPIDESLLISDQDSVNMV